MDDVELRYIEPGTPQYAEAAELRYRTMYAEWDVPRERLADTDGRTYLHLAAFSADRIVGYGRLHLEGGESKIYQVCVDPAWRGRGVARRLVEALADRARVEGRAEVELDARRHVIGFYEKLGFVAEGAEFPKGATGLPHRVMRRSLDAPLDSSRPRADTP